MAEKEPKAPRARTLLAVAALGVVVYAATRKDPAERPKSAAHAAGWEGAVELYRNVALWAGKRAMHAELKYWEAVG